MEAALRYGVCCADGCDLPGNYANRLRVIVPVRDEKSEVNILALFCSQDHEDQAIALLN